MMERSEKSGGLRERKRNETLARIATTGLKLFDENGYDATTLETIAAASGISARTFFYYFKTKDEILQYWQSEGFLEALGPTLSIEAQTQAPFEASRSALLKLTSRFETDQSVVVDRILNSTDALRARKQAIYIHLEEIVLSALRVRWPTPEELPRLRIVSMMAIGAMRLAMQTRREDATNQSLTVYLEETFSLLAERPC